MEFVWEQGQLPCFRYEQFLVCQKKYRQQEEKVCWKDWSALCSYASSLENKEAHIVGHIDPETAKKWLDWDLGQLFVVAVQGDFAFCFEGGTIVPV